MLALFTPLANLVSDLGNVSFVEKACEVPLSEAGKIFWI